MSNRRETVGALVSRLLCCVQSSHLYGYEAELTSLVQELLDASKTLRHST
jgi:hypothetical protein